MSNINENITRVLTYVLPRIHQWQSDNRLILENSAHASSASSALSRHPPPFILAVSGLQGSGKSFWAAALVKALKEEHDIHAVSLSLDDLYKTHDGLVQLRNQNPGNGLLRTRGQPGTHDEVLASEFFEHLKSGGKADLLVPAFDKSKFAGQGDRVPKEEWKRVSRETPIELLVLEGWCVGFQALSENALREKWKLACQKMAAQSANEINAKLSILTLPDHPFDHLRVINDNLRRYNETFLGPQHMQLLIHLDTDKLVNVYLWRLQQEHALIQMRGSGMTDDAVVAFVKGYMPAYELYLDELRVGMRSADDDGERPGQLRVLLDEGRNVLDIIHVSP